MRGSIADADLVILSALLARLEHEPFDTPVLRRLRSRLETTGRHRSQRIAKLARLLHLLNCRQNQFFTPIAGVLLWSLQLALAIDDSRVRSGPAIASWLAAVGEFEALCALAAYAWECPGDVVPEVAPRGGLVRGRADWASLDPRIIVRAKQHLSWGGATGARGQRVEHVGQEHALADGRDQRRAGSGRGTGACRACE